MLCRSSHAFIRAILNTFRTNWVVFYETDMAEFLIDNGANADDFVPREHGMYAVIYETSLYTAWEMDNERMGIIHHPLTEECQ